MKLNQQVSLARSLGETDNLYGDRGGAGLQKQSGGVEENGGASTSTTIKDAATLTSRQRRLKSQQQYQYLQRRHISRGAWTQLVNQIVNSGDDDAIPTLADELAKWEETEVRPQLTLKLPEGEIDDLSTDAGSVAGDASSRRVSVREDVSSEGRLGRSGVRSVDADVDEFGVPLIGERATTQAMSDRLREIFGKVRQNSY
eukprot:jgi/Hompol1/4273/HPOL_007040-RA